MSIALGVSLALNAAALTAVLLNRTRLAPFHVRYSFQVLRDLGLSIDHLARRQSDRTPERIREALLGEMCVMDAYRVISVGRVAEAGTRRLLEVV